MDENCHDSAYSKKEYGLDSEFFNVLFVLYKKIIQIKSVKIKWAKLKKAEVCLSNKRKYKKLTVLVLYQLSLANTNRKP